MGIKKNILYSSILTVSSYLFPLLTFPYVTRVLGVANFGICSFYDSVVGYFILFSMLGILNLGIREIARVKGNREELTKVFSGLLSLNLTTTFISIIVLIIVGLSVPKLAEHPQMIYIGVAKVLANTLLVEWFYKGIEDFKYITYRSIAVRSIYVLSVFVFVKDSGDYVVYFGLTTLMFVVNSGINLYHLRKFINLTGLSFRFKEFVKPFIILGVYQLLTSMYTTVNVVILGFVAGYVQIGYYSTCTKLYAIMMSFYSAFSGVLLPRMSNLIQQKDVESFNYLITKSASVLYLITVPLIIITVFFAPTIIEIIAGKEFMPATIPMRIIMPMMLIQGLDIILVYQILFPLKQDKSIFINSVIGAVVGVVLNIILVPHFQSVGSAIVLFCSEVAVFCSALRFVLKIGNLNLNIKLLLKIALLSLPVIALLLVLKIPSHQGILSFIITSVLIGIYFCAIDVRYLHTLGLEKVFTKVLKK